MPMFSLPRLALLPVIVAVMTGETLTGEAVAGGGSFARGCAARDMQVMMLIESSQMPAGAKDGAVRAILHARILCFEGQVMDALALYDDIAHGVTDRFALSSQQP